MGEFAPERGRAREALSERERERERERWRAQESDRDRKRCHRRETVPEGERPMSGSGGAKGEGGRER